MDIGAQFGVDLKKFAEENPQVFKYPPVTKGRVAHIDGDFTSYQVSAESKAELDPDDETPRKSFTDMCQNAYSAVDHIRRMAGADTAVVHITGAESTKGGRFEQALLKPYQENRADKAPPERLYDVREYLGKLTGQIKGRVWLDREADDGMAKAQYDDPANAIVCSLDKDLRIVPGLKLDMSVQDQWKVINVEDKFGSIWIDETKSQPKLVGLGTAFFWAQLLMGDPADNISGLPACPGVVWTKYQPTAAFTKLMEKFDSEHKAGKSASPKMLEQAKAFMDQLKPVGPKLAYSMLKDAKNDKEAFEIVLGAYKALAFIRPLTDYRDGSVITPTGALFGEMKLLWMRRTDNPDDVIEFIKDVIK